MYEPQSLESRYCGNQIIAYVLEKDPDSKTGRPKYIDMLIKRRLTACRVEYKIRTLTYAARLTQQALASEKETSINLQVHRRRVQVRLSAYFLHSLTPSFK
jgi:hypothetical protein